MNNLTDVIGNERLKDNITKVLSNGNISHAYILSTMDVAEREEIANAFAKAMLCQNFDGDSCTVCKSCITFDSQNNPDLEVVEPNEKGIISVDQIRTITSSINVKPFSNNRKVYIIKDADLMNESAQNALLKTLEEPNEYTKLLLLVGNMKSILPTVLSRCVTLKVMTLAKSEIKLWCELHGIDTSVSTFDYYLDYAQGNLTNFLNITKNQDFIKIREEVVELTEYFTSNSIGKFMKAKEYLNANKDDIDLILDILEVWFRDVMLILAGVTKNIINSDKKDKLNKEANMYSIAKIQKIIGAIKDFRKQNSKYANFKLAAEVFQIKISEE